MPLLYEGTLFPIFKTWPPSFNTDSGKLYNPITYRYDAFPFTLPNR